MKNTLLKLTAFVMLSTYSLLSLSADFNPEFSRDNVNIIHNTYPNKATLMSALKRPPLRKLFKVPGRKVQKRHGFSVWYVNKKGEPVGECNIYYVEGDEKTMNHEIDHCKYGRYHRGH